MRKLHVIWPKLARATEIRNTSMKILYITMAIAASVVSLVAQSPTVTQINNSNGAISPNLVIGDSFTVRVTGPPNQQVTTDDRLGHYVDGMTDSSGVWTG